MTIKNFLLAGSVALLACSYSNASRQTILLKDGTRAVVIHGSAELEPLYLQGAEDRANPNSADYAADPHLSHISVLANGGMRNVIRTLDGQVDDCTARSPRFAVMATPETISTLNRIAGMRLLKNTEGIREMTHILFDACVRFDAFAEECDRDFVQLFMKMYATLTAANMSDRCLLDIMRRVGVRMSPARRQPETYPFGFGTEAERMLGLKRALKDDHDFIDYMFAETVVENDEEEQGSN
ncbi:MAG: hypothetical protein LBI30_01965 [Holosporales bacterium]|jgi:hypothetical protein|nr:hypothetical protein [Holosporales bacterium]